MNKRYYPRETEIALNYINQFNYNDKYISSKELESMLEKNKLLSIEELEKVLVNISKVLEKINFIINFKVFSNIILKKKHLYLFYYCLMKFLEYQVEENKLKKLENFFREIFRNKNISYNDLNLFERNFYDFLKTDSLKNKGFERYLYEKFTMYFKNNEQDIYRFCKEYYILIDSLTLKKLLYRYLEENKENRNKINLETLEIIKNIISR